MDGFMDTCVVGWTDQIMPVRSLKRSFVDGHNRLSLLFKVNLSII
jgi:hypothetical protein